MSFLSTKLIEIFSAVKVTTLRLFCLRVKAKASHCFSVAAPLRFLIFCTFALVNESERNSDFVAGKPLSLT